MHLIDLWLNKLQNRKKMYPPMMPMVYPGEGKYNLRRFFFPRENFPFPRSPVRRTVYPRYAVLPRFARPDNRSALLDILSFFPTTSESKSSLSEIKIRLRLYSFPGHTFGTMEEYIFFVSDKDKLHF